MELMNVDRKKKRKMTTIYGVFHLLMNARALLVPRKGDISIGSPKLTVEKAKIESTNSWKESLHMVRFCARWSR